MANRGPFATHDSRFARPSIRPSARGRTLHETAFKAQANGAVRARPTGGDASTGLGPSIVKRMVEVMNGCVWCEGGPGRGATFILDKFNLELPTPAATAKNAQT